MLLQEKSPREIEQACAAVLFDPVAWIDLATRLPRPAEHVMVRYDDGMVEVRYWDAVKSSWSRSPFEGQAHPVAWAPLPRLDLSAALNR